MKIVLAIDSFKGSLSSSQAEEAAASGLKDILGNECPEFVFIPMADGGEGLLDSLKRSFNAETVSVRVFNPLMEEIEAEYATAPSRKNAAVKCALIEMARCSGLTLIDESRRNPWITTTYGLGQMIAHALEQGCREFIVGIGGSATNDAGTGMLQALGYKFYEGGRLIEEPMCGGKLACVTSIDASGRHPLLDEASFTIACDVKNPFYGPNGAAFVYAPQKGANLAMVKELDAGLRCFASVAGVKDGEGAGAAGGLGGGFATFLSAELRSGAEIVLEESGFYREVQECAIVVTGEGKIDAQTSNGKLPQCVLKAAHSYGKPVLALGGKIEKGAGEAFELALQITPEGMPLSTAMKSDIARDNIMNAIVSNASAIRSVLECR